MKPIHPLRRWLFENQETLAVFAARLSTSQGFISDWLTGKKLPSGDMMGRVAIATKNAVTPNDFVTFKQTFDKPARKRRAS